MAKVSTAVSESIYRITRWLGVNEAPEGEATLKMGEAALMRNFSVTAGGALKKRAGSRNVAGLLREYVAVTDEDNPRILLTESGASTASFTMYPGISIDSVGKVSLTGEARSVTALNCAAHVGYYYMDAQANVHKFCGVSQTQEVI